MQSLKKKYYLICFTLTLISPFIGAQTPLFFKISIPTKPKSINIQAVCQDGAYNTFQITLHPTPSIPQPLLTSLEKNFNALDVPETIHCQELIQNIKRSHYSWLSNTVPQFPIDHSIALYNFKVPKQNTNWLLLKDQAQSSDDRSFYQVFLWKNNQWQLLPNFFQATSFYGFENGNVITGAYEGPYFIKLISKIKDNHLALIRKEMWQDDQLIFTALPHQKGRPLSEYRQNAVENKQ